MLIDYAADLRAPTPTGAAEFTVPVKSEIVAKLMTQTSRMINAVHRLCEEKKNYLDGLARGIPNLEQILSDNVQKLDERVERLKIAFKNCLELKENRLALSDIKPIYIANIVERKKENLSGLAARLESVSIESVLKRGFAWVKTQAGKTVYGKGDAVKNKLLQIDFADGNVKVMTMEKKDELQGDLFDNL